MWALVLAALFLKTAVNNNYSLYPGVISNKKIRVQLL